VRSGWKGLPRKKSRKNGQARKTLLERKKVVNKKKRVIEVSVEIGGRPGKLKRRRERPVLAKGNSKRGKLKRNGQGKCGGEN